MKGTKVYVGKIGFIKHLGYVGSNWYRLERYGLTFAYGRGDGLALNLFSLGLDCFDDWFNSNLLKVEKPTRHEFMISLRMVSKPTWVSLR